MACSQATLTQTVDERWCNADQLSRQELGAVTYQYNVMGTRGPRKMVALVPALDAENKPLTFRASARNERAILARYAIGSPAIIGRLVNCACGAFGVLFGHCRQPQHVNTSHLPFLRKKVWT